MPHEFELTFDTDIEATPEQVWEAITNGPGVDSWFMGSTEIEPREGGATRFTMGGYSAQGKVISWEPAKRFAYRSDANPDGTFMAFEYLIEARDQGTTVLRMVHSGFLGDDWEEEYDALKSGDPVYLAKLAAYLKHFPGRTSTANVFELGPQDSDRDQAWTAFLTAFGTAGPVAVGQQVRVGPDGLDPVAGTVAFVTDRTALGVVTASGLYALMYANRGTVVVEHHCFDENVDTAQVENAWKSWLSTTFA